MERLVLLGRYRVDNRVQLDLKSFYASARAVARRAGEPITPILAGDQGSRLNAKGEPAINEPDSKSTMIPRDHKKEHR